MRNRLFIPNSPLNDPQKQFFMLGQKQMSHHLEVGYKLGGAMARYVYVLLAIFKQRQQKFKDPSNSVETVISLYRVSQLTWRIPGSSEGLSKVRSRH